MSKATALPYVTLDSENVSASDWFLLDENNLPVSQESAEAGIPDWSYDSMVRIGREVTLDAEQCLKQLNLSDSKTCLKILVTMESGQPAIRKNVYSRNVCIGDKLEDMIVIDIPGKDVSGDIKLSTLLLLADKPSIHKPFIPVLPGSRLWEDKVSIPLEGIGSRFPVRSCSFRDLVRVPDHANWFLDCSPEFMDHAFAGSVILYINTDNSGFSDLVSEGDVSTLTGIKSDVATEICIGLLSNREFRDSEDEYPVGSVGTIANQWLASAFPGRSREEIYQILKDRTSEFFVNMRSIFE